MSHSGRSWQQKHLTCCSLLSPVSLNIWDVHRKNPEREIILLAMRKDSTVHSVTDLRSKLRLRFHLAHFDMILLLVTEQIRKAEDGKLDAYSSLTAEMTLRIYELKGEASLGDSHSMLLLWSLSLWLAVTMMQRIVSCSFLGNHTVSVPVTAERPGGISPLDPRQNKSSTWNSVCA